jgi:hypothetical protein
MHRAEIALQLFFQKAIAGETIMTERWLIRSPLMSRLHCISSLIVGHVMPLGYVCLT